VEFVDLLHFVSIAETGSFTKSAIQNNVAQSALSRRIRDLETELGTALFYRNGRGVVLTEAGELFLIRARGILAEREALEGCLQKLPNAHRDLVLRAYTKGTTINDLATLRGQTPMALYKWLHRTRQALQECVQATVSKRETA
jgi:DNA-binding transcriptional LysR family regulator